MVGAAIRQVFAASSRDEASAILSDVVDRLEGPAPKVSQLLQEAEDDLLAFLSFPTDSSIADTLAPQVPHLKARDTTLLLASQGPLAKLIAYRERMGCAIGWVSSGSEFNRDIGFLHTEDELKPFLEGEIPVTVVQNAEMCGTSAAGYVTEGPGLSVYALADGIVYRTLCQHGTRPRACDGLLRPARSHADGSRRER